MISNLSRRDGRTNRPSKYQRTVYAKYLWHNFWRIQLLTESGKEEIVKVGSFRDYKFDNQFHFFVIYEEEGDEMMADII